MRYFKKEVYEDHRIGQEFPNVTELAHILGVKQPYLHKVMRHELIISDKQYFKFVKKLKKHREGFRENLRNAIKPYEDNNGFKELS